jgi:hypothetical protein
MKGKAIIFIICLWVFSTHTISSLDTKEATANYSIKLEMAEPHPQADSLDEHVQRMHEQAICTLNGLEDMFESYVWLSPDTSFEARITAWNEHGDFKKWMGRLGPDSGEGVIIEFRDRLDTMIARMESGEITYSVKSAWINYCKFSPTNAFVRSGESSRTIFLCPKWFEQHETQQVATLIHELVHTFGFSHPQDTDTPLKAVALAKEAPELAIQSPENFESLVELYVCR